MPNHIEYIEMSAMLQTTTFIVGATSVVVDNHMKMLKKGCGGIPHTGVYVGVRSCDIILEIVETQVVIDTAYPGGFGLFTVYMAFS